MLANETLEQTLGFYKPDVLPVTQHNVKALRETKWFSRILFYKRDISTPSPTNNVKALKEEALLLTITVVGL